MMRTRTTFVIAIVIGALILPCALSSQTLKVQPSPSQPEASWFGTWKLNLAKSNYNPGPPPYKSATSKIEPWEDGLKITYDMVGPRGETAHREWSGKFDGRDYPVEGTDFVLTNAYRRIDDHTYEAAVKVDGNTTSIATIVLSPDGKTMTTVTVGKNAQGQDVSITTVYDKQ